VTVVVAIELLAIAWIRNRHMDTPFLAAAFKVVVGVAERPSVSRPAAEKVKSPEPQRRVSRLDRFERSGADELSVEVRGPSAPSRVIVRILGGVAGARDLRVDPEHVVGVGVLPELFGESEQSFFAALRGVDDDDAAEAAVFGERDVPLLKNAVGQRGRRSWRGCTFGPPQ